MRSVLLAVPLLMLAATAPVLEPGRWVVASAPSGATLDGRNLDDLPYAAPQGRDTLCLTAADAADPVRWLTRDVARDCTLSTRSLANGRVDVAGSCPPQAPGLGRGTVRITGRWSPAAYDLHFATANPSETGVMGFTGTMTGRRVGACTAEPPTPHPRP